MLWASSPFFLTGHPAGFELEEVVAEWPIARPGEPARSHRHGGIAMRRFVGLDVHKHFIEVCVLDTKGKVLSRCRVGCQREELLEFARKELRKTDHVALEATTNTW